MCGFLGVSYSLHLLEGIPQARVGKSSIINLNLKKSSGSFPYFNYPFVSLFWVQISGVVAFLSFVCKNHNRNILKISETGLCDFRCFSKWCCWQGITLNHAETAKYYRKRVFFSFFFLKYMFVIITAVANKHGKMF